MDKTTDFSKIDFPVSLENIYLSGESVDITQNYKALTGKTGNGKRVFSIVSKDYSLITNMIAFETGKSIFKKYFKSVEDKNLVIFNIIFPESRSYCHIDVIHDTYRFNVWEKETYIPFMRITNSYNKTRSLNFEIGFCRKLCENGVIFEKNTVNLSYIHYKKSVDKILADMNSANKTEHLKKLEKEFTDFLLKLKNIKVQGKYFLPLVAKIFELKFNINSEDKRKKKSEADRKEKFTKYCFDISRKYINELGENAYSVFNTATEFAKNKKFAGRGSYNTYQTRAGEWLKAFAKRDANESIEDYIKGYKHLVNTN